MLYKTDYCIPKKKSMMNNYGEILPFTFFFFLVHLCVLLTII